jgi:predicted nucleic acid-binding protein
VKYPLDTNVYLNAVRSELNAAGFRRTFFPLLPATYLSAVVAHQLAVDAADRRTRANLREFLQPMERTGRVVTPAFDDWLAAADVLSGIRTRERAWRSKLPALLNDALIASCARRIGAVLFSDNRDDFRLIHRHMDFSLHVLHETPGAGRKERRS